jgi:hypothetical protein
LDILTGRRRPAAPAAQDRLFAMSTAYVTLESALSIRSRGSAAIVFQPLATTDFQTILADTETVLGATAADSQTRIESSEDTYGFRWLSLKSDDFESLVVGINTISSSLQDGGYGERLLCAVFAFEASDRRPVYWIYNFKRGRFYPFAPAAGREQRDSEHELVLKAQMERDLPIETELGRWFPLWGIPI